MLNISGILSVIQSHAAESGYFDQVLLHEPKSAPTTDGLTAAVWVERVGPAPRNSGLKFTSALLTFSVRVYGSMLSEPQDDIDMNMVEAVDALLSAYSGDFQLGGESRQIDLLGQTGTMLECRAGYLGIDNKIFRVMDITLPVIVDDVWAQEA